MLFVLASNTQRQICTVHAEKFIVSVKTVIFKTPPASQEATSVIEALDYNGVERVEDCMLMT